MIFLDIRKILHNDDAEEKQLLLFPLMVFSIIYAILLNQLRTVNKLKWRSYNVFIFFKIK